MRSATTGLRLCGIADEPFCPRPNGSCTSAHLGAREVADLERELVERRRRERERVEQLGVPVALRGSASRSAPARGRAARRRCRSSSGSVAAYVPTAPESLPTRIPSSARATRRAVAVELERPARELDAEGRRLGVRRRACARSGASSGAARRAPRRRRARGRARRGSARPPRGSAARARCRRRPTRSGRSGTSGPPAPSCSATASTKAAVSWWSVASSSATRSGAGGRAAPQGAGGLGRDDPELREGCGRGELDVEPGARASPRPTRSWPWPGGSSGRSPLAV